MSDTISEFTNFISNDPLMLALCIAIVVLIIVFILVLILGKKKDDSEEVSENTGALLQSDISEANLKSTQEFAAVNEAEPTPELSSTKKIPVVPPAEDITDKEAPISVDDALKLKEEREQTATTTIDVVPPASPEPTVSEAASAPVEVDPFGVNSTPAPAPEVPSEPAPTVTPEVVTPEFSVPEAPAPLEVPAPEPAPVETPTEPTPAPVIPDGALPGIPDSTVNNSDDTSGMFGNLVESLNEENKEQVINTPAPETVEPAPIEAPTITTGSEASSSVPLAGSPVIKEEKKVNFEPGAKAPEVITGNEYSSAAPVTSEPAPEDDIELPMFSAPAKDDKLDNISGESFNI